MVVKGTWRKGTLGFPQPLLRLLETARPLVSITLYSSRCARGPGFSQVCVVRSQTANIEDIPMKAFLFWPPV